MNYTDIVKSCLETGTWKENRTGVRCLTTTPKFFEHDMSEGFPLVTEKFTPIGLVASELEFFIGGLTDKQWLIDRSNHIWDEWASKKAVEQKLREIDESPEGCGLEGDDLIKFAQKEAKDLGPLGYSWGWRRFGQEYLGKVSEKLPPVNAPFDQLNTVIKTLKENPNDRRMIISAWNPNQLKDMALPPCHFNIVFQHIEGRLSLNWSQRSVDSLLGLSINIASYALLLKLVCKEVDMEPHMLTGNLIDCHIYENHMDGAKEMISRTAKPLPTLEITNFESIWDWTYKDIELSNYEYHPKIKLEVAV